MTTRLFAVLALAFMGLAVVSPLAAQTIALRGNVPFEFGFAGKTMPAGEYLFQADAGSAALRLKSLDGGTGAVTLSSHPSGTRERTGDARITFNRYGTTYFLSSVVSGTGAGLTMPISKTERELARTASVQKYEILAVLARL